MTLLDNPIFLTQRRLVHRAGVLAPLAIALLMGLSLLAALTYHIALPARSETPVELGKIYYAWLFGLQALVLIGGGFSRISRTLIEERKAGLLDSNRLTPLGPVELVVGYWLGAGLREIYAAAILAPVGLVMILISRAPLTLWLGTQALLVTTAMVFGLLAVLTGMVAQRARGGVGMIALLFFAGPVSIAAAGKSLTNFLLPFYAIIHLFHVKTRSGDLRWNSPTNFFGLPVSPLLYTFALQAVFGALLWRGAIRKFTDQFRPALAHWQALFIFALLVFLQHGLLWQKGATVHDTFGQLTAVHVATLLLGCVILATRCLYPHRARLMALQRGPGAEPWVWSHSGPTTALLLAAIGSVALATQFYGSFATNSARFVLVAANLFVVFLSFALLLELCRLKFQRRNVSFFALSLFVLYGLPYFLGIAFSAADIAKLSMLTPGVAVLNLADADDLRGFGLISLAHGVVIVGLAIMWYRCWQHWLRSAEAATTKP